MESISGRIRALRKKIGMSQSEFANLLGLKQGIVSVWELGKTEISDKTIKAVCYACKVNEEWLRNGAGEPFQNISFLDDNLLDKFHQLLPEMQDLVLKYMNVLLESQEALRGSAEAVKNN